MSGSLNRATLIGNVGRDPEIRRTQDGRPVANLSIATSDTWKDKTTGERKEKTEWHRVVVFNEALCKIVEQYVKKGMKVLIEGPIRTVKWTDQAGNDRYSTQINLENFNGTLTMLGGGNGRPVENSDDDPSRPGVASRGTGIAPRNSGGISSGKSGNDMDDDIPF
jgi:single-strand DNA-binding protein